MKRYLSAKGHRLEINILKVKKHISGMLYYRVNTKVQDSSFWNIWKKTIVPLLFIFYRCVKT